MIEITPFVLSIDVPTQLPPNNVRATLVSPQMAAVFRDFLIVEHNENNFAFLADLSPFLPGLANLRAFAHDRRPKDATKVWFSARARGIYEYYIAPGSPKTINLSSTLFHHYHALAAEPAGEDGKLAPQLTIASMSPAINYLLTQLESDRYTPFRKLILEIQAEHRASKEAMASRQNATEVVKDERKHTHDRFERNAGGKFVLFQVAADDQPLLQVSAGLERDVSVERNLIAAVVGVSGRKIPKITGIWAKSGANKKTILVDLQNAAQQRVFRKALEVHGLTGYTVQSATRAEINEAFAPGNRNKLVDALHPSPTTQVRNANAKLNKGQLVAQPLMDPLVKSGVNGFEGVLQAIEEGVQRLKDTRRSKLATVTQRLLKNRDVQDDIARVLKQGSGRFWLCHYRDPQLLDGPSAVNEIWLYRGPTEPPKTEDPKPLNNRTKYARIVKTEQAR